MKLSNYYHIHKKPHLILLIFTLIAFLVFGNSLFGNFVFDDLAIVRDRDELKNIQHLPLLLFEPYHKLGYDGDLYRPLTMISFSLNYFITGEKPWGFHLFNILLHTLSSWLVYLSLYKITKKFRVSLLTSLLFLVLPIHTEAINAIVGRAEMLSLIFLSCSLITLLSINETNKSSKKISKHFYASLLFLLALLSKESAIGLLPLYLITIYSLGYKTDNTMYDIKNIAINNYKKIIYLFFAILAYFTMRGITLTNLIATNSSLVENPLKFTSLQERLYTSFKVLGLYTEKIILPFNNLSSDHSYNQITTKIDFMNIYFWLGISIFIIALYGIQNSFKKKSKQIIIPILAGSYFMFFYLIVSNLFFTIGTILAERLMYIPSIGYCLITAYAFILFYDKLFNQKISLTLFNLKKNQHPSNITPNKAYIKFFYYSAICIILTTYSIISFNRNIDWKTEESLFLDAAIKSPNSVLARNNAGAINLINNNLVSAGKELITANSIYDKYNHASNNLGLFYLRSNNPIEARKQLEKTLINSPGYFSAVDNLILAYLQLNEFEKAKRFLTLRVEEKAEEYLIQHLNAKIYAFIENNKTQEIIELYSQTKHLITDPVWNLDMKILIQQLKDNKEIYHRNES